MDEQQLISEIGRWLERVRPQMEPSDYRAAQFYFDHDEWEMAFEIVILYLLEAGIQYEKTETDHLKRLSRACRLDRDGGVFDYDVYRKLCSGHLNRE